MTLRRRSADPALPAPSQPLLPDLKVAEVVGWDGETPTVPEGLVITAYAHDLANPRTVHTLPNGDVLVVQSKAPEGKPLNRPKDIIRGWIMGLAAGGGGEEPTPPTNLITLLREFPRALQGHIAETHYESASQFSRELRRLFGHSPRTISS